MRVHAKIALFALAIAPPIAAQSGTVSGTVRERSTQMPIEGVAVRISGTLAGSVTKANGSYVILGVPPGVYNIEAQRVGYRGVEVAGVTINAGVRRVQDFELQVDGDLRTPNPARPGPAIEPGVVGGTRPSHAVPPPAIEPGVAAGRSPAQGALPSFEHMLIPPELVMQHQRALDLTSEQRRVITEAVKALQNNTVDLQWNLQAEQQALIALLEKRPINEQAAIAQMAKLVDLEDAVKRTHLATLIRIKNVLTDAQIQQLNSLRGQRYESPKPLPRRDQDRPPEGVDVRR